jgi:hypothetical protein
LVKSDSDLEEGRLYLSHELKEVRNWAFGFEGVTSRNVAVVNVAVGTQYLEIILQRGGPGGRVPVTFSSDGYGDDSITFQDPGTWRIVKEGDEPAWARSAERDVASLEPTFGRLRPLLVDFDKLRSWIQLCDQQHEICQRHEEPVDISTFRLIDVEKMCILRVDGSKRPPFATLSYVWGTKPFLRLVQANIKELEEPGCLKRLTLPSTIRDAIEICAKLHIKHLWIDSLCIIQDDESDMIQVIDKMDSIYGESILTIVAASGLDAHSGIPGVRTGTRTIEQHTLEIQGVELIDSVDTGQFRFQGPFEEPLWIANTPWARRAWTFQEALVTRRSLFFTAEQVYWSCREGLLSEDTTEHFRDNQPYGNRLDSVFSPQEYLKIATTFSTRRLTYEADIGRAYLGTQNYLDRKWGGHKFSWGLPHGSFGSFMMWERYPDDDRIMRQGTHPIRQRDGSIVKVPFPSWSWMGWTDGRKLVSFYGDEPKPHSPTFYVFNSATELTEVRDEFTLPSSLREHLTGDSDLPTEVTEEQLPQRLHLTPSLRHSALVFYTEIATVRYNPSSGFKAESMLGIPSDLKMRSYQYPFSIQIGKLFYQIVEEHQNDGADTKDLEEIDLVAVFSGQMTKPRKFRGQYRLYCWPVTKKDCVRMRASYASTVIFLTLWQQLPRRRWELVTML